MSYVSTRLSNLKHTQRALGHAKQRKAKEHKIKLTRAVTREIAGYTQKEPFIAYGTAKEAFESEDPTLIISGPAGTGKSRVCLEKVWHLANKYPGLRALILRKVRSSLTETGLYTFEMFVLGMDHPLVENGPTRGHRHSYVLPNGSEIVVGGIDKPGKILSSEYDIIYIQQGEEITITDVENIETRLRASILPFQQLLIDVNPGAPTHHLYTKYIQGVYRMIFATHEDNPTLFDQIKKVWTDRGQKYLERLNRLTGVRLQRFRYGKWVAAEGAIYSFEVSKHVVKRFDIPYNWTKICVVDFGFNEPFVALWLAVSPDKDIYVYREYYKSQRLVEDHAKLMLELEDGEKIAKTIADHDSEDVATLQRYLGRKVAKAWKSILPGIEAIEKRLTNKLNGKPKPRLFYMEGSSVGVDRELAEAGLPTSLLQEWPSYAWEASGDDARPNKDIPMDYDNHALDALRYGVAHIDRIWRMSRGKPKQRGSRVRRG